jgi:hypothetical protein
VAVQDGLNRLAVQHQLTGVCKMPTLTFLGIENPLGVLGPKIRGVVQDESSLDPIKHVTKEVWDVSVYAHKLVSKYNTRAQNIPKDAQETLVGDTVDNREYMLKLLRNRAYPNVRLAMCSSLNSMLKYLDNYCQQNPADNFDTVIILGHGSMGSINIGLGPIGIGPYLPVEKKGHQSRKDMRYAFGLDERTDGEKPAARRIRDLSKENVDIWTAAFANIQNRVTDSETGYFHLFLMGCEVGAEKKKEEVKNKGERYHKANDTTLQGATATVLSGILRQDVCISAPTKTIYNGHLDDLLTRIDEIRESCAKLENVMLKDDGEDPVPLVSRRS